MGVTVAERIESPLSQGRQVGCCRQRQAGTSGASHSLVEQRTEEALKSRVLSPGCGRPQPSRRTRWAQHGGTERKGNPKALRFCEEKGIAQNFPN